MLYFPCEKNENKQKEAGLGPFFEMAQASDVRPSAKHVLWLFSFRFKGGYDFCEELSSQARSRFPDLTGREDYFGTGYTYLPISVTRFGEIYPLRQTFKIFGYLLSNLFGIFQDTEPT